MFEDIIKKAEEYLALNKNLELVEIVESSTVGTPRKEGAFMFVDSDGKSFGTVGGGNIEYKATQYAKELLLNKQNGEKKYELSQAAAENIGMVCGGESLMKFTFLDNSEKSKKILEDLSERNKSNNTVYIFGGGHVSMELAKLVKYVGFEYVVWDDREDFAKGERFPEAKQVICKPYDEVLKVVNITKNDMVVVMTRGHAYDYIVEKQALQTSACYIGVIGSSNKNKVIKEKLLSDGYTEKELERVCAPIGFAIAAETPEEIAISIVSELIMFRSKLENRRKATKDNFLIDLYKNKF